MFYMCQIFTIYVRTVANLQRYGHKCQTKKYYFIRLFSLLSFLYLIFLSLLRICLSLPSSQLMFFLFSQSDASKTKAAAMAKRGGKAAVTSSKSMVATAMSNSSMVVNGFVGFYMVVIDGGRWVCQVCHGGESLSWVHRWWQMGFNNSQWLVVEGAAWQCELESGFSR